MQIITATDPSAISRAVEVLAGGGLVIYPTETCYGIGVDAENSDAVARLLTYKGDRYRQVAIAVADRAMAEKYVDINEMADNLYRHFLPGPITVISNSRHVADERLESGEGTLGIRLPAYTFALNLIRQYGKAITATSGNTSGKKEPYSLSDWQKYTTPLKQQMVDLFIDGGHLAERPTSTVVDTTLNDPVILRQGEFIVPLVPGQSFTSHSPEQTREIGSDVMGKYLNLTKKYPIILALQGDLGVGKTQFSKGVAVRLDIKDNVNSPTYTLLKEYRYTTPKYIGVLYHIDTWRLANPRELESTLHLSSLMRPGSIIVMEWAGKAKSVLEGYKKDYPVIVIDIKELDENTRQINYTLSTPDWS